MLDSICNNSQTCSLTTHPTLLHLTSSQILYSYSLYKKDKQLAQALIPKTQSQVAATSAATMTQLALTRNRCWHTPHSTVSVPKPGTCTWGWMYTPTSPSVGGAKKFAQNKYWQTPLLKPATFHSSLHNKIFIKDASCCLLSSTYASTKQL